MKDINVGNKKKKTIFTDDTIVYVENSKQMTPKNPLGTSK